MCYHERDVHNLELLPVSVVVHGRIHLDHGVPVHIIILLVRLNGNILGIITFQNHYGRVHLIGNLSLHAGEIAAQELGTLILILGYHALLVRVQKVAETAKLLADSGNLGNSSQVDKAVAEQVILNLDMTLTSLKRI